MSSGNRLNLDTYREAYQPRVITLRGTDYEVPRLTFNLALELETTFKNLVEAADAGEHGPRAILDKLAEITGIPADELGRLTVDELGAVQAFLSGSQALDRKRYARALANGRAAAAAPASSS